MGTVVKYKLYMPKNFLNKQVNESIVFQIMNTVYAYRSYRRGNPLDKEPDFIVDGQGLEVTFASADKTRPSFIDDFCDGVYSYEDADADYPQFIINALERKAQKHYATSKTSVAILCMLEMFNWVDDAYGSMTSYLFEQPKLELLNQIRETYLQTNIFENVYLIVPSLSKKWFVFDIKNQMETALDVVDELEVPYFEFIAIDTEQKTSVDGMQTTE